jgi:hypothetical protein
VRAAGRSSLQELVGAEAPGLDGNGGPAPPAIQPQPPPNSTPAPARE